jgi:hypothetical protein
MTGFEMAPLTVGFEMVPKLLDTDTKYKAVEYIETYTGRKFFPLAPAVDAVTIIDIAHHLSNQCRYSGATRFPYSVGQHSLLLAIYAETILKASALDCLQILIHDAPEAYLVDIPRPVKQFMPQYRQWDKDINDVIRSWLNLDLVPMPPFQDEIDSRVIVDERAQVMCPDSGNDWGHRLEPLGITITPWTSYYTEQQFLMRYAAYTMALFGQHQYLRAEWGIPTLAHYTPFKTLSTDAAPWTEGEPAPTMAAHTTSDLIEVDLRGRVGRVRLRSADGMMVRDTEAGKFPRGAMKWIHGDFELVEGASDGVR